MANQNTVAGIYNYPAQQLASTTNEVALLVPSASGVYPSLPSPLFPLSTTTYPALLYVTVPQDIASSFLDGHPFEIKIAGKLTTTATSNFLMNLYQVTNAAVAVGPAGTGYPAGLTNGPNGTGVTKLTTGTATAVGTGGASVSFTYSQQYTWDSVSKLLVATNAATMFQKGASVSVTQSAATVSSLGIIDLNFFPTFTFSGSNSPTLTLTEFVINRA
jgi:hypothetical protein